ncbi:MAG: hypothetical protein ACJ8EL_02925, partial [Rhizomicrobium sp.]
NLNISLASGFTPTMLEKFYIIDRLGTDVTPALFANGATVQDQMGNTYLINYLDHDPADMSNLLMNDISLTFEGIVPIPEPSTWLAAALAGFAIVSTAVSRWNVLVRRGRD